MSDHSRSENLQAGAPDNPRELPASGWGEAARLTWHEFRANGMPDWGAALTFYAVLSIFPALLVLVSLLGLLGQAPTQTMIDNIAQLAPGSASDIITSAIRNLQENRAAAGVLFFIALAGAVWSASGYVGAFMRASNFVWDTDERRPVWKTIPLRIGLTLLALVVLTAASIAVVITGSLAARIGDVAGVGSTTVTIWNILKWPVMIALFALLLALLYYSAPDVSHPGFTWVSPGSILAVLMWLVASAVFALYVSNFGAYNKTYGSLGGVIIFLVWLWISNIAVLIGAQFNAALERERASRWPAAATRRHSGC